MKPKRANEMEKVQPIIDRFRKDGEHIKKHITWSKLSEIESNDAVRLQITPSGWSVTFLLKTKIWMIDCDSSDGGHWNSEGVFCDCYSLENKPPLVVDIYAAEKDFRAKKSFNMKHFRW